MFTNVKTMVDSAKKINQLLSSLAQEPYCLQYTDNDCYQLLSSCQCEKLEEYAGTSERYLYIIIKLLQHLHLCKKKESVRTTSPEKLVNDLFSRSLPKNYHSLARTIVLLYYREVPEADQNDETIELFIKGFLESAYRKIGASESTTPP